MSDQPQPDEVLLFWFGGPAERGKRRKRWFEKSDAVDRDVRERFMAAYEKAAAGALAAWQDAPHRCLALILLLDQFPRHMFRGSPRAFAADPLALAAARHAVARGYDRALLPVERLFVYLPFEHSESLEDQLQACELTRPLEAFEETADAYRYALAHRDIIQRFGRFPHRNAILGRPSTPEEIEFLKQPGSSF
ncbi:MAG TPA: DUF924 family protein [Burkholderiales bacterium]|nr:DUF924 family protein [Burkholderiales bacterium]